AAGERVPSVLRCRVVSIGAQVPLCRVRTGVTFVSTVKRPSGCATTWVTSSVSATTGTALPVVLACAAAAVIAACCSGVVPDAGGILIRRLLEPAEEGEASGAGLPEALGALGEATV